MSESTPVNRVPSDIEISRAATPVAITEIAAKAGIPTEFLEPYGRVKAKVDLGILAHLSDRWARARPPPPWA